MAQENRAQIKTYFETGDVPTQSQFANSFDSQVFWVDDVETDLTSNSDSKVPTVKAVVDGQTFTKDGNNNVFYNGVTATLDGTNNIFLQGAVSNVFGTTTRFNIIEQFCSGFTFGDGLEYTTIKSGSVGEDYTASPDFDFLYGNDYPSEIFRNAENTANYHRYYDPTNDRIVLTNLTTLVVSYIGGSSGTVTSVNAGTNISVTGTATDPIINSLADRYKTTSTTSILIGNGSRTFTVDANLAYIPLQEVLVVYDASNHMHGTVTSYSGTTLVVDVKNHTGGGTFATWVINLDGVPVDAITGAGTVNRLAYFTAAQVIDDAAAITAARALKSDANGIPTHFDTATEPSLTELSYVKGVTSAIQTQLDGKRKTIQSASLGTAVTGTTANTYCKGVEIPLGWFVDGDCPMCNAGVIKTGTAGTLAIRMYLNTTNNLSGSPILVGSVVGVLAATTLGQNMQRAMAIIKADGSGSGTRVTNTTSNQVNDFTTRTTANTTLTPNFTTTTYYFIIALQNGSSADSSNCEFISIN